MRPISRWDQQLWQILDLDLTALACTQHFDRSIESACTPFDPCGGPFFSAQFFGGSHVVALQFSQAVVPFRAGMYYNFDYCTILCIFGWEVSEVLGCYRPFVLIRQCGFVLPLMHEIASSFQVLVVLLSPV